MSLEKKRNFYFFILFTSSAPSELALTTPTTTTTTTLPINQSTNQSHALPVSFPHAPAGNIHPCTRFPMSSPHTAELSAHHTIYMGRNHSCKLCSLNRFFLILFESGNNLYLGQCSFQLASLLFVICSVQQWFIHQIHSSVAVAIISRLEWVWSSVFQLVGRNADVGAVLIDF